MVKYVQIYFMSFAVILIATLFSCTSKPNPEDQSISQMEVQQEKEKAYQDAWACVGAKFDKNEAELKNKKASEYRDAFIRSMQGTWEYKGRIHVYGSQYEYVSCRLVVDGNKMTFYGNNGINDQGNIKDIDFVDEVISFGEHSTMDFHIWGKEFEQQFCLYFSREENKKLNHISETPKYKSANSRSSYSNSSSSDSHLMTKFNKLNEEGRKLVGEIEHYYRSGQAGPWVITDVYRLKSIQDEKISLAQDMGNRDLESLCRQQKAQTLAALRQMGF